MRGLPVFFRTPHYRLAVSRLSREGLPWLHLRFARTKKPSSMAGLLWSLLNTRRNDRMEQIYDMAT